MLVDIWACGVVLYNLISGLYPFEFEDEPNILDLHEKIAYTGAFSFVKAKRSWEATFLYFVQAYIKKERIKYD